MYPKMCNIEYLSFMQVAAKELMAVGDVGMLYEYTWLITQLSLPTSIQQWIQDSLI